MEDRKVIGSTLTEWHDKGQKDATESESTLLGETNRHTPFFGFTESEREANEAYVKGFENGVKTR